MHHIRIAILCLVVWLLAGCTEQDQSYLATRAVEALQTTEAIVKTTAVAASKTAAAEAAQAVQTQVAAVKQTAEAMITHRTDDGPFTVDSDLTRLATVSGAQLDAAIKAIRPDSPLIGLGQGFVDAGKKHGINAFYIAAHSAWESSWGTSPLARDKNNLFGYGAYDSCPYECAWTFKTKEECVDTVMLLVKTDYLTEGGKYYNGATLRGMNVKYATDQNWQNGIASIMNSLASKAG
ncbi:glucosaminidase domain-containing protein [Candidatus Amarolinea dominans]|uniref:N-acetylglucosaminidase n=1 Tax=Candidatus Amarolinea dominans TaxID=3140696 RepID=UPI003136A9A5|nr:glucosaminidase domain-containing protein [Anaerolineae bacterium]